MAVIGRVGLPLPCAHFAHVPRSSEHDERQVRKRLSALRRRHCQPAIDLVGHAGPRHGRPTAVGGGNGPQQVAIEAVVAAMAGEIILDRFLRQVEQCPKLGLDAIGRTEACHLLGP